jgi:hypothetical protein
MRALLFGSLFLIPFAAGSGQEKDQNQGFKVVMTHSLSGPEMYKTWCAPCHGVDGKGNGPAAAALKKAPADLTLLSRNNHGRFPVERVRDYVEGKDVGAIQAHGSREMPIWGDVFRSIADTPQAVTYRLVTLSTYLESLQVK